MICTPFTRHNPVKGVHIKNLVLGGGTLFCGLFGFIILMPVMLLIKNAKLLIVDLLVKITV
jgi:hypothetical protein